MKNLKTTLESFINESSLNKKKFYAYYIVDEGERPYSLSQDAIWVKFDTKEKRDEFVKKVKKEKKYKGVKIKLVEKSSKEEREKAYYDREPHYQSISDIVKERERDEKNAFKSRKKFLGWSEV